MRTTKNRRRVSQAKPRTARVYEGVAYYPFRVTFTLTSGKRVQWVRWAPAMYFLRDAIYRELNDYPVDTTKPGRIVALPWRVL